MDDKAVINVCRKSHLIACANEFAIFIDGKKIGSIANDKQENFEIAPGKHTVVVKLHWSRSETVELDLTSNSSIDLECGVSQKYVKFGSLWSIVTIPLIGLAGLAIMVLISSQPFAIALRSIYLLLLLTILLGISCTVFFTRLTVKPGGIYYLKKISE